MTDFSCPPTRSTIYYYSFSNSASWVGPSHLPFGLVGSKLKPSRCKRRVHWRSSQKIIYLQVHENDFWLLSEACVDPTPEKKVSSGEGSLRTPDLDHNTKVPPLGDLSLQLHQQAPEITCSLQWH